MRSLGSEVVEAPVRRRLVVDDSVAIGVVVPICIGLVPEVDAAAANSEYHQTDAMHLRSIISVLLALSASARAEPTRTTRTTIDWARGLVTAEGVGIADRHAPNPAVARGTSRRGAQEAAKKLLATKLGELPFAGGGKVGDKANDKAVKARLDAAVDAAITLAAEPETDGAWRVSLAVPIEAVRLALSGGPRVSDSDGDQGPAVIVLEGVTAKPAVGWKIGAVSGATLWLPVVPDWAKDAPRAKAKAAKAGVIEAEGIDATAATLFVIITKP